MPCHSSVPLDGIGPGGATVQALRNHLVAVAQFSLAVPSASESPAETATRCSSTL